MFRNYSEHYQASRRKYRSAELRGERADVYALTVTEVPLTASNPYLALPPAFRNQVATLARDVRERLSEPSRLHSEEHDAGAGFALKLADVWDLRGLEALLAMIVPQLERTLFGCYAVVSSVHVYRSVATELTPRASWLWHYDNNPREAIKLLIYLTDCDASCGPFEYLRHAIDGHGFKVPTSRMGSDHWCEPLFEASRIPANHITTYLHNGYQSVQVVGPMGTAVLFDNNCIHRANIPVRGHRDAVVLNIRPALRKLRPFLSRAHTGSWMHVEPFPDPSRLTPQLKRNGKSPRDTMPSAATSALLYRRTDLVANREVSTCVRGRIGRNE